jgi:hypothetical protein
MRSRQEFFSSPPLPGQYRPPLREFNRQIHAAVILKSTAHISSGGAAYDQVKGKVHSTTCHEDPEEEQRYSSTLSLTSGLDRVGRERHASAALAPVNTRYSLYRRLGGPQVWSGRMRKISSPPGFDPRTVHPVASRNTN